MRDITERERLVQALRAHTAAKERFFAHMSHELRTPVNALLGYSSLLLEGIAGELPAKAAEMIERMARNAQHLRALVDDLLDLGRLDAGKVQLTMEVVSLPVLLRETLNSVESLARAKGLAIELEAADVPRVCTDAQRVQQIVLNLLSNAVKFTDRGGVRITIERQAPDVLEVCVADTGVGIASEDLDRVFDEFVQVGAPHGGTGLGLAISRRLARLLSGDLTVQSTPAKGTCFTLTLPTTPAVHRGGCPAS